MAYVEPQHNAAGPTSATRGVLMVDQGKEAGLRARDPHAETASDRSSEAENSSVGASASGQHDQAGRARSRNGLSDQTRNRIASQLRAMYDTVTQQPVPDRFAELIAKLDSADHKA
ncbi:NepR family anti-sigma factor [Methylobacterium oryzae]